MRIGFDITPLTNRRTGVGNYCYYLLKHLLRLGTDCRFVGFASGAGRVKLGDMEGMLEYHQLPLPTRALYGMWSTLNTPKLDTLIPGIDVFHATNYYLPPTRTARRVVTLHDLSFLTMPELCSPKIRRIFTRQVAAFARDADAVLACSHATAHDIVSLLHVNPAKVRVTYEAVDEEFAPVERDAAQAFLASRYGVQGPFLLFVGTLEPRKNIPCLLRAFGRIAQDCPHTLVLAGTKGWNSEAIFDTIQELGLGPRVVLTGFVPSHVELANFYSAADVLVYPSLYEGFGLPLLEAMVCGCPVVTSNNSSMPEIAGDAALCVDARNPQALAEAVMTVLSDETVRTGLVGRGRARAARSRGRLAPRRPWKPTRAWGKAAPMRVLLNGLQAGNRSGTGRYVVELARRLPSVSGEFDIVALWPRAVERPRLEPGHRGAFVTLDCASPLRRVFHDQVGLRQQARRLQANVVHYPANVGSLARMRNTVITVHDLSFLRNPEWYGRERAAYYRFAAGRSARLAARLIADSEATAADLEEFLRIPPGRIDVIPLGVSDAFRPADAETREQARSRYGLPARYFLFTGTLEPRKNVRRLIQAWRQLADRCPLDLVIAGRDGWKCGPIRDAAEQSGHAARIHFPGFIPEADLPAVLSAAHVFVWPTLWEGFGLPPLEAMACGTPVVTSNTSSLPEVAGNAALLVDPLDVDALADAMLKAATEPQTHTALRERGLAQAAGFTWDRTARMTVETYRKTLL